MRSVWQTETTGYPPWAVAFFCTICDKPCFILGWTFIFSWVHQGTSCFLHYFRSAEYQLMLEGFCDTSFSKQIAPFDHSTSFIGQIPIFVLAKSHFFFPPSKVLYDGDPTLAHHGSWQIATTWPWASYHGSEHCTCSIGCATSTARASAKWFPAVEGDSALPVGRSWGGICHGYHGNYKHKRWRSYVLT